MATELLYEHIIITSVRRAKLIIRTLQHSGGITVHGSHKRSSASMEDQDTDAAKASKPIGDDTKVLSVGHGQWVRHLEVRPCTRSSNNSIPFLNMVAYILALCPNLQSFSGAWTDSVPKGFLAVIMKYHGDTLQGLQWEQTNHAFSKELSSPNSTILSPNFLSVFQRLRVLDLRTLANLAIPNFHFNDDDEPMDNESSGSSGSANEKGETKPKIVLPYLSNLRLPITSVVIHFASTLCLPNLHSLTLDASHACTTTSHSLTTLPPALHEPLNAFLQTHGPLITILELIPFTSTTYKPSPFPLSPALFLQPDTCPNLRTLIFDCRERPVVSPSAYDTLGLSSKHKLPPVTTNGDPFTNHAGSNGGAASALPATFLSSLIRLPLGEDKQHMSAPHLNLRKIGIRGLGISRLYPNKPTHTQSHLRSLIGARASGLLPRLEKVQSIGFLVDASTDTFARDIFIWWTERFEEVGIDFVDGEGVVWAYEEEREEHHHERKSKEKAKKSEERGDGSEGYDEEQGLKGEELGGGVDKIYENDGSTSENEEQDKGVSTEELSSPESTDPADGLTIANDIATPEADTTTTASEGADVQPSTTTTVSSDRPNFTLKADYSTKRLRQF